jgi:hypothetical protein
MPESTAQARRRLHTPKRSTQNQAGGSRFRERHGDDRWPWLYEDQDGTQLIRDGRPVRALPAAALSLTERLPLLDEAGIDHQVLSPALPLICDFGDSVADAE